MATSVLDRILSLEEASERYHVSASWLRRLASEGRITARKVGKTWLVLVEEMEALEGTPRPRGRPPIKTLRSQTGGPVMAAGLRSKLKAARRRK